jgi:DNA replication protein DnaC
MLVQELLRAKRDLRMERWIKKLSKFEALIIDDLGYQRPLVGPAISFTDQ